VILEKRLLVSYIFEQLNYDESHLSKLILFFLDTLDRNVYEIIRMSE